VNRIDARSNLIWFPISELVTAKHNVPNHPVFSSRFFFNKLAQAILNREVQTILSGSNIVMNPGLNRKLYNSRHKLFDSNSDFVILFTSNDNSRRIRLTPSQRHFIELKLSAEYLLKKDDRLFYLDFIEPWAFSSDKPYDYTICDALTKCLVDYFLPKLRSDLSDTHVYLEL
jgi:hypothetical protein